MSQHRRRRRDRAVMPTTGRPICATRYGSRRPWPPPAPPTPHSSKSAPTPCSPTPSATPSATPTTTPRKPRPADPDDTISFSTAPNTTNTNNISTTSHLPDPHPQLPTTPGISIRHLYHHGRDRSLGHEPPQDRRQILYRPPRRTPTRPLLETALVPGPAVWCRGGYRVKEQRLMACRVVKPVVGVR